MMHVREFTRDLVMPGRRVLWILRWCRDRDGNFMPEDGKYRSEIQALVAARYLVADRRDPGIFYWTEKARDLLDAIDVRLGRCSSLPHHEGTVVVLPPLQMPETPIQPPGTAIQTPEKAIQRRKKLIAYAGYNRHDRMNCEVAR